MTKKNVVIPEGSGGKGGGHTPVEAPNTLRSRAQVGTVIVVSEGVIHGPVDPKNKENAGVLSAADLGKAVSFNNTFVKDADGNENFKNVAIDWRAGDPEQKALEGFPEIGSPETVNQEIRTDLSLTKTMNADVDKVNVTIQLPAGLYKRDASNGDTSGTDIALDFWTKKTSETAWTLYGSTMKNDKTNSAYEFDVAVKRPAGDNVPWDIKVSRQTPDSTSEMLQNKTYVSRIVKLYEKNETYNNTAIFGVKTDAEATGGTIPVLGFDIYGLIVKIPNNYNPTKHTYTSPVWNGGFTNYWTNNPAWILYDLLTNDRYGMGAVVPESAVDIYSFYNAGVYCDEIVDGEPRYTFTYPIAKQEEPMKVITAVAATMRASVVQIGNKVTLVQDKKASPRMLITASDVKNGDFNRIGTSLESRTTAADVIWNDPNQGYQQAIAHYQNDDAIAKYGYNVESKAVLGCMSYKQAMRAARWIVETNLRQTETITFTGGLKLMNLRVNDIVEIYDNDYADWTAAGRTLAGSTTQKLKLDRDVTIGPDAKVKILDASGLNYVTHDIVEHDTTTNVVTFKTQLGYVPKANSNYVVESTVKAKPYRILTIKKGKTRAEADFVAVAHDNNKYDFVEGIVTLPDDDYTNPDTSYIAPISGLQINFTQFKDPVLGLKNKMVVVWDQHKDVNFAKYSVMWRKDNGLWSTPQMVDMNQFEVLDVYQGTYEVKVSAVNMKGMVSLGMSKTAVFGYNADNMLSPPLNLRLVAGTEDVAGSNFFKGNDLHVTWDANPLNIGPEDILDGYRVVVINNDTRTEMFRTFVKEEVLTFDYTMAMNKRDGGPYRNLAIQVFAVDGFGNDSALCIEEIFSNPAPGQLMNLDVHGGYEAVTISFDTPQDADYDGIIVWAGTEAEGSNFPLSASHVVFDGKTSYITLGGKPMGETMFYRIAAYDTFGKRYDGIGLNVSGSISATTSPEVGVKSGPVLPTEGMKAGDLFFLTTTKRLYTYNGTKWMLVGVDMGPALPTEGMVEGDVYFNSTDNKLYTYDGTKWVVVGVNTGTAFPTNAAIGDTFYNTTDKLLYTWNGTKWKAVGVGSSNTAPSNPSQGDTYYNLQDQLLYTWNGTKWDANGIRSGNTPTRLALTGMVAGDLFMDTDMIKLFRYTGSGWSAAVETVDLTGTITETQIAAGAVTAAKINVAALDQTLGNLKADVVGALQLVDGAVGEVQLANDAVTALKLAGGAVTELKLASGAVTASKTAIAAINPQSGNLSIDSVTTNTIKAGAVVAGSIATDAITSDKIVAGSVTALKIATDAVVADKIQAGAVVAGKLAVDSVVAANIKAGEVTAGKLAVDSVVAANIKAGEITAVKIAGGTITGDKLFGATITGDKIAALTLTAANIAAGTITGNEIKAGTITVDKLNVGTINASGVYTGTLNASQITAGSISASLLSTTALNASNITSGTMSASRITGLTIDASQITSGTIDTARLNAITISASQINSGVIDSARIATSSLSAANIDASKITSGTMNAARITSGTITATQISATAGITAGQLDTRGLTVKDWNGNVIFGAGTPLDYSSIGGTKPPANATNGATFGVNVNGTFNAGAYIQAATIGTLQLGDNTVTVPVSLTGSGGGRMIDYFNNPYSYGGMIKVASRRVYYPATTQVAISVFWKAVPDNKQGSNSRVHVTCDGGWMMAASNSNMNGYAFAQSAAGSATIGAGWHDIELWFGNDWGNNHWFLHEYTAIIMGTMK